MVSLATSHCPRFLMESPNVEQASPESRRWWSWALGLSLGLGAAAEIHAADWQKDWERTVAAAKKEGTVVVAASPSPETRVEMEPAFAKQFGFRLEYLALGGAEATARAE